MVSKAASKSRSLCDVQNLELQPEQARRVLQISRLNLGIRGTGRINEDRHDVRVRQQFAQNFQTFGSQFDIHRGVAGYAAAGPVEACDQPNFDRVGLRPSDRLSRADAIRVSGDYGASGDQSTEMPAALMGGPHLAISLRTKVCR